MADPGIPFDHSSLRRSDSLRDYLREVPSKARRVRSLLEDIHFEIERPHHPDRWVDHPTAPSAIEARGAQGTWHTPAGSPFANLPLKAAIWTVDVEMTTIGVVMTPMGVLPTTNLDILGNRVRVRILRYLARSGGEHTGRSLARALGEQHKQVLAALRLLWQAGLLVRKAAPPAYLYSLNLTHYLVKEVLLPAFQAEASWLDALGQEVQQAGGEGVESVLLFGSLARDIAVADPESDVDIAVLVDEPAHLENVRRVLEAEQGAFHERFGHAVSPMVLSVDQFRRRLRKRDPLIRNMVRDGQVIAGRPVAELLSGVTVRG